LNEGDVSVRERNAWNCHLKKYSVPCIKYSIILNGHSSISSCTLRDHGIPGGQCSMPLCKFPGKGCNIFVHSFEKRVVFLAQKKTTLTEPPPPENRK